jgi:hypothetical protein
MLSLGGVATMKDQETRMNDLNDMEAGSQRCQARTWGRDVSMPSKPATTRFGPITVTTLGLLLGPAVPRPPRPHAPSWRRIDTKAGDGPAGQPAPAPGVAHDSTYSVTFSDLGAPITIGARSNAVETGK